ncbi:protein lin-9 homolog [Drosophila grimshawi]|nr:protein lin-9 homolog [Drosophila grimshawi]
MPNKKESRRRLLRSQTHATKDNNELFVHLPKFTMRLREEKGSVEAKEPDNVVNDPKQMLYKFVKQSKCQCWIWYEFNESTIDKAILASTFDWNDYLVNYLQELETRQMSRHCWQVIRRSLGKARRFSPAFIELERNMLEENRYIVRQLQQRRLDVLQDKQLLLELLPKQIPLPLAVDTKVISLLSVPRSRLCKGRIVSYDPRQSRYLVKFNIGSKHKLLSIPDCLLHALQECNSVPSSTIVQEFKEKQLLAEAVSPEDQARAQLITTVLQLQKLIDLKRKTVQDVTSMNEELLLGGVPPIARRESKQSTNREKLQLRHASNIMALHRVNAEILKPLRLAQNYLNEYETSVLHNKCLPRNKLYEKCRTLAEMDMKAVQNKGQVEDGGTRLLILRLQTLLHVCGELGNGNNIEVDAVMEDVVTNMLVGLPTELSEEFDQVVGLLKPLSEQIRALTKVKPAEAMIEDIDEPDIEMDL